MLQQPTYPYSRIEYDVNNPGTVKRSSAPHNSLKMGSGREVKSFSMTASGELNYVFGYARGWTLAEDFILFEQINDWDVFSIINMDLLSSYNVTKTITVDADNNEAVSFIDFDGKVIATCFSGTNDEGNNERDLAVTSFIKGQDMNERYIDIHLPEGTETTIEIGNQVYNSANYYKFDILDLDKNVYIYQGTDGQSITLSSGYYRIINTEVLYYNNNNQFIDPIPIRYDLNYYDFSLYYYDKAGRLITTIAPNGIDNSYNPNIITTTASDKRQFFTDNPNIPFFNGAPDYEVEVPLAVTPANSQQFSFALAYLTVHDLPIVLHNPDILSSVARGTPPSAGLSSSGSVLTVSNLGGGPPISLIPGPPNCPTHCDHCLDKASYNYDIGAAQNQAQIICNGFNRDFELYDFGPTYDYYCIECIVRPMPSVERDYDVIFDIVTDNGIIIDQGLHLRAKRHNPLLNSPYNSAVYWEFEDLPNHLLSNVGQGSLIDITASLTTTGVKAVVTNVLEAKRNYDASNGTWHFIQSFDFIYINELDFNITTVTNEFPGGYPEHKASSISQYNSISQVLKSIEVDAGVTDFVYSEEGLLRFSRNDKQKAEQKFSYTNYDELGRPIESGEYQESLLTTGANILFFQNHYNEYSNPWQGAIATNNPIVLDDLDYQDLVTAGKTSDVTKTLYDYADSDFNTVTGLLIADYKQKIYLGDVSKTWKTFDFGLAAPNPFTTWYSYDDRGRVMWMVQDIEGIGIKTIDYVYNNKGDLEKIIYQKNNTTEEFTHQYSYDTDKRLINVETKEYSGAWLQQAHYEYYQHGPLKRTELADELQGIDYLYTTLGQLKAINSPNLGETSGNQFIDPGKDGMLNNFATDVFGMSIDYFSGDYTHSGTFVNSGITQNENYNGNIKSVRWNTDGINKPTTGNQWMYNYEYNKKQWLKTATFGAYSHDACQDLAITCSQPPPGSNNHNLFMANISNHYKVSNLTYDPNGNILSLNRNAYGANIGMDAFTYSYLPNSNKLDFIADAVTAVTSYQDLKDGQTTGNYQYDEIGQLINNATDGQHFTYNVSGLVTHVYNDAAKTILIAQYFYDDKGYRYKKSRYDAATGLTIEENTYYIRDVAGTIQHIYTEDVINTTNTSEYPLYGTGRIGNYYKNGATVYELTDHLGNVRATVNRTKSGIYAIVENYADYYPFGEKIPNRNFTSSLLYKYTYQGQEHDEETGLEAFELRLWDGRIGRWLSTDPYRQYHSPYLGMGNNPIIGIDPRGGYCETCPQNIAYSGYVASDNYFDFSDGVVYLSSAGGFSITAFSDNFISNLNFSPDIGNNFNSNLSLIKPYTTNFWGELKNSNNIVTELVYETANDAYLVAQLLPLSGIYFDYKYGLGNNVNLDNSGATYEELNDAFPRFVLNVTPFRNLTKAKSVLNATQFSSAFKGSLSRLTPKSRGVVNRTYNTLWKHGYIQDLNEEILLAPFQFDNKD